MRVESPLQLRPGTDDEVVWRSVVEGNEYRLPERLAPADVVLDLGAHVGVFSHLALERGSRRVIAFEAEPENARRARANLAAWGPAVEVHQKAVWRSDRPPEVLHFSPSHEASATGGGNVFFRDEGPPVESIALDDVLASLGRVRFLKIDVEAAEFPILLTSRRLRDVDEIAGEFHEVAGALDPHVIPEWARVPGHERFTIEALAAHLRRQAFSVWWVRMPDSHLGLFFATRLSWPAWLADRLRARVRRWVRALTQRPA